VELLAIRHGETSWSLSGRHTGATDVPLTDRGREAAARIRPVLAGRTFSLVLVSPMRRARETCELAGLAEAGCVEPDLAEWNYGQFEGLTREEIEARAPDWLIFRDGCPGGESPVQVSARADRVIGRALAQTGDVVLFAHGHLLRVLVARWIGLAPVAGQHFLLDTGSVCILAFYQGLPAIKVWNAAV
jgi:probable phosphoglycerate mutase